MTRKLNAMLSSFLSSLFKSQTHSRSTRKQHLVDSLSYLSLEPRQVLSAFFPAYADGKFTLGNTNADSAYPLNQTFKLETNPNATKTIYLDFTGHQSFNNAWRHSIAFPRYDTDGRSAFSTNELKDIQRIFQNVAEDYAPFDVNVTTKDPGWWDLTKNSRTDTRFGVRVVITQATGGFGNGYGGLAKIGTFDDSRDTPAFVFAKAGFNNTAMAVSHEAAHTLGLEHDGYYGNDYHPGVGSNSSDTSWGPIMGAPYFKNVTQWSRGDYQGATNGEDDIAMITRSVNGIGFKADDVGNTRASAKNLRLNGESVFNWGIIGQRSDVDMFKFTTPGGRANLKFEPMGLNPNLDIEAKLFSANGNLIATNNAYNSLDATINRNLARGTYYVQVDGVGKSGVYSDYGSLGFYTITGTIKNNVVTDSNDVVGESGSIENLTDRWKTVTVSRSYRNPIVVVGPLSNRYSDPATVQVRNVRNNRFEVRINEWDYLNGVHNSERAGFLIVEKGTHQLSDGTTIIAGNGYVNHNFRRIGFGGHFSKNPVLLLKQLQPTDNRP